MKWVRFRSADGGDAFGQLQGDEVLVHEGQLFGEAGSEVEVEIDGIGVLKNVYG